MSVDRSFDMYLSPYKEIPADVPGWDSARAATWPATTSTLFRVGQEAVLIDALMTVDEGRALSSWIQARTGSLKSIFVTHAHADHFFGADSVLAAFPEAALVATPDVASDAAGQVQPSVLAVWERFFPGQIADEPRTPQPLLEGELGVGDIALRPVAVGGSDVPRSSVAFSPDLEVVVTGDVAYNGIHMWMAGSDHASRVEWLHTLDAVEQLGARTLIAGHRDPAAPDDDAGRLLDESRRYIEDFDACVAQSDSAQELIAKMLALHGDRGNPYTLWTAATNQFAVLNGGN